MRYREKGRRPLRVSKVVLLGGMSRSENIKREIEAVLCSLELACFLSYVFPFRIWGQREYSAALRRYEE